MQISCNKCKKKNKLPIIVPIISYSFRCNYCGEIIDLKDNKKLHKKIYVTNVCFSVFIVPLLYYYCMYKAFIYLRNNYNLSSLSVNLITGVGLVIIASIIAFIVQRIVLYFALK